MSALTGNQSEQRTNQSGQRSWGAVTPGSTSKEIAVYSPQNVRFLQPPCVLVRCLNYDVSQVAKLGIFFVRKSLINQDQLGQVLAEQTRYGKKLGELLIERNLVSRHEVERALVNQQIKLGEVLLRKRLISLVQLEYALANQTSACQTLGQLLLEEGMVSRRELEEALKEQYWRRNGFWFIF